MRPLSNVVVLRVPYLLYHDLFEPVLLWICKASCAKLFSCLQSFSAYAFVLQALWLPVMALAEPIPEPTAGCALMLNENMAKLLSKILSSGQRQTGKVQVCLDATYKVGNAHWGLAICSVSNKHVGPECKFAASEAIPIALGWIPKENYACLSSFLITMCETYASKGLQLQPAIASVLVDGAKGTLKAVAQAGMGLFSTLHP